MFILRRIFPVRAGNRGKIPRRRNVGLHCEEAEYLPALAKMRKELRREPEYRVAHCFLRAFEAHRGAGQRLPGAIFYFGVGRGAHHLAQVAAVDFIAADPSEIAERPIVVLKAQVRIDVREHPRHFLIEVVHAGFHQ